MNKIFQLSTFGVLVCACFMVLSAQEPRAKPSTASPSPLELGLLVDNSGSLRSHFQKVIDVSKGIVESAQAGDRLFIVRFVSADKITIVHDFTTNKSPLTEALEGMYVEGGLSAITDAVYMAAEHLDKNGGSEGQKRALILITDGADEGSFYKTERLLSLLREKEVRVYVIGFPQALGQQSLKVQERARKYLIRLADESGGRLYFPTTKTHVEKVASSVLHDIRNQ